MHKLSIKSFNLLNANRINLLMTPVRKLQSACETIVQVKISYFEIENQEVKS